MLPVIILSAISLLAIKLDSRLVFAILAITTLIYADRKNLKLTLRNPDKEDSYFNMLLFSTFLALLSCFALPKDVVFASMFLLFVHEFRKNSILNIAAYSSAAIFYFLAFELLTGIQYSTTHLFFVCLAGGLSASLVESVETDTDKRLTLLITLSTVFTIFKIYIPSASVTDLGIAFLVSFLMSLLALKAGVADESGLMSATLVGTTLILFTDIRFFAVILLFYALGSAVTKYRYEVKQRRGIEEQAGGARGYTNVFGNSLAGLFFAIQYSVTGNPAFAAAFVASVGAALSDTMASEIGKAGERAYLITTFEKVKPGVSGGISLNGELAGLVGAVVTSALAVSLGILDMYSAVISAVAAFTGMHIDSILGATLEKKGYLTNSTVNFLATLFAGIISLFFF
ncbi:TIGR00297 family protein [Archaeoglobus neptunius]|uniref:TIGR00297 family protein n=1 Tax=Archaeoglobus neptunius TaxID=2798580 RepID=UPI0019253F88|nr:TIGR00297 family protein [Archaeoglobus neptunius]